MKRIIIILIILLAIIGLLVFEMMTGYVYHLSFPKPTTDPELEEQALKIERALLSNTSATIKVDGSQINVRLSINSLSECYLCGIHDDGSINYRLEYQNTNGTVSVLDNGVMDSSAPMVYLNGWGKSKDYYEFPIGLPDDFGQLYTLSFHIQVIPLPWIKPAIFQNQQTLLNNIIVYRVFGINNVSPTDDSIIDQHRVLYRCKNLAE